ncbi:MAG TPA: MFS transporter [Pseudonocardiaceae bacterium]|nr:MFS transporter [Pseudonocardiaceae bacterium]
MTCVDDRRTGYRALLGRADLRRLAGIDVCARLPQGMVSITLLLVASQHGAFGTAGLVVGGYTLGQALTAPLRGRLADRLGLRAVVPVCLTAYLAALIALGVTARVHPVPVLLVGTALAAGLCTPPLSPAMRGLWARRTPGPLRPAGFALDAAVFDLAMIAGPALASVLATGLSPTTALVALLALTTVAATLMSRQPRDPTPRAAAGRLGALRSPALRRLLVTAALVNLALSAVEVSLTAYVRDHHATWAAGPLLAGVSIGSIAGSLLLGSRNRASKAGLARLTTGYLIGLAVLTAATLFAPLLAVAAPLAGLCLGPTLATLFTSAADAAPAGTATEAQSWINTIMSGGASLGAVIAGLTAANPMLGIAIATGATALAAVTAIRRHRIRPVASTGHDGAAAAARPRRTSTPPPGAADRRG